MTATTPTQCASSATPNLAARLARLLAAADRYVTWYGAHRAWPANEPAREDR